MVRTMLSESLEAVISQTLLKTRDGNGRTAAHEIMIATPAIRHLIRENKIAQMYSMMQTSGLGMQTLDQCLSDLIKRGMINYNDARAIAKNPDAFMGLRGRNDHARPRIRIEVHQRPAGADGEQPRLGPVHHRGISAGHQGRRQDHAGLAAAAESDAGAGLVRSIMNERQTKEFEDTRECNFAIAAPDAGASACRFIQQGRAGMVLRTINTRIPSVDDLDLPPTLHEIVMSKRGLVIVTGATGSGKSTSLAAMLDHRNAHSYGHIITIEDPIEYVHAHQNCIVTQREVGIDTESWHIALKNTLRQAPDVILIGEIRDRDTMEYAMQYAETGHLCLATLHANNANQAIDRIVNFFPEEKRQQLLIDLSLNLKAMISQRLLPRPQGPRAGVEIMIGTPLVADLIFKGEIHELKEVIKKSREQGMISFDQALFELYETEKITYEDALKNADSLNDLRLMIKLHSKRHRDNDLGAGTEHLNVI
jgi:twitching motility protein PilU